MFSLLLLNAVRVPWANTAAVSETMDRGGRVIPTILAASDLVVSNSPTPDSLAINDYARPFVQWSGIDKLK